MSKRTEKGEKLTELILETFRLNGALIDRGNKITEPFDLTSARWQVMGAIDHENHAMTVAQIARRMGLSRQGVQRIVNDLEQLGMLSFEPNLDHKRAPLVLLSESGRDAIEKINDAQARWVNEIADEFTDRSLQQALKTLLRFRQRIEDS